MLRRDDMGDEFDGLAVGSFRCTPHAIALADEKMLMQAAMPLQAKERQPRRRRHAASSCLVAKRQPTLLREMPLGRVFLDAVAT